MQSLPPLIPSPLPFKFLYSLTFVETSAVPFEDKMQFAWLSSSVSSLNLISSESFALLLNPREIHSISAANPQSSNFSKIFIKTLLARHNKNCIHRIHTKCSYPSFVISVRLCVSLKNSRLVCLNSPLNQCPSQSNEHMVFPHVSMMQLCAIKLRPLVSAHLVATHGIVLVESPPCRWCLPAPCTLCIEKDTFCPF